MADLFLSRARLRRDAPIGTLRRILVPDDENARVSAGHQLVWTLLADAPDRERDFLWRESDPGTFFILSRRPPVDIHQIFELDHPKEFAPNLSVGDRLMFSLRANATVAKAAAKGERGKPHDVVMNAIHALGKGLRTAERTRVYEAVGRSWLVSQGEKAGFKFGNPDADIRVLGYHPLKLVRRGGKPARISVLEFEGLLSVTDAALFLERLAKGFGRAKAFGCGLMLIRRA